MSIKVLVFESDAAFAGELRNELGKLGCSTCVVDDGSVGLQQASAERPDLILLSIELPRMNGFSVCNKLKKDAGLKDVPLIIMSSESSDETFEQHRKLRTRAEDYVHKPIAFGELLGHIRAFVQLGAPEAGGDSDGIVIDDEVSVEAGDEDIEDDEGTQIAMRPDFGELRRRVDPEVDSFTDAAFGRLQDAPVEPPPREVNGAASERVAPSTRPGAQLKAPHSQPPSKVAANDAHTHAELEKLRAETEKHRGEAQRAEAKREELEKELAQAHEQITRIHHEADSEAERMQRDLDELKTRVASIPPKAGGVSSREFLDLREALNKKDKEILALKTQLTVKDKDIFEARDKSLALERQTSDLDDKILAKERELAEMADRIDELSGKIATREAETADLRRELATAESNVAAQKAELQQTKAKREQDDASHEAALAASRAEHAEALSRAEAARVNAIEEQGARHQAELEGRGARHQKEVEELTSRHQTEIEEQGRRHRSEAEAQSAQHAAVEADSRQEHEAALDGARRQAAVSLAEAVSTREGELRAETDAKLAALHRAQQDELSRARNEAQQQLENLRREAGETLASRERDLEGRRAEEVAALSAKAASELADARERIAGLERDLDGSRKQGRELAEAKQANDTVNEARIAELRGELSDTSQAKHTLETELAHARDRMTALDVDLSTVRGELESTQKRHDTEKARADRAFAKWDADRTSLERAKDALAVALAQLDEAEARPIRES
jgi:DNA-binding response OmpR family regulator/chromosome segregation ATPase